ncbi:MAG TPA: RelA/SpoT domain-containing protein, partial [Verrucomicrobiales bacterium]|nr:RelA/SpoT domain-containing protein [Verrucomicrobiales bacterium]
RLSQMQDIAGCRVVVADIVRQDQLVASLATDFPSASVIDRRDNPSSSHGYRAVHIVAEMSGKPIEIQIRSSLQHLWAELSEKCADVLDPAIKYGGGPSRWREFLSKRSELVASYEAIERKLHKHVGLIEEEVGHLNEIENSLASEHDRPDHHEQEARQQLNCLRRRVALMEQEFEGVRQEFLSQRKKIADHLLLQ